MSRDAVTALTVLIAAIKSSLPQLMVAREIIADFHQMIGTKAVAAMALWMERAADSLVASFYSGVRKHNTAVLAAITSPWSNRQAEGQITKLKLAKRQMYAGESSTCSRLASSVQSEPSMQRESQTQGGRRSVQHCVRFDRRDGRRPVCSAPIMSRKPRLVRKFEHDGALSCDSC